MAQVDLDISLIRNSKGKEIVSYLGDLRLKHSDVKICQSLFEAVNQEELPPSIFSVFLSWSSSPSTTVLCIHNGPSRSIRMGGIKQLGKALADPEKWESIWRAMGGTKGLAEHFAKSSVTEVECLTREIGRCNRGQRKVKSREKAIEELLHALLPSHYPGSVIQSQDRRPIRDRYAKMVPACSSEFVEQLLNAKDKSNPLYKRMLSTRLIRTHGKLLQKCVIEYMFGEGYEVDHLHEYLQAFVYTQPPLPSQDSGVSASMKFANNVLRFRLRDIDNDKKWPSRISEADIFSSLLQRSLRRRLAEAKICDVIMLGLQILEAKPKLKPKFQSLGIWSKLFTRWKRAPKIYEDALTLALRLELGGSGKTIGRDFYQTMQAEKVKPEMRWLLLRLYCLHVPKTGVELDTANDFTPLANQPWPSDIFYKLSKHQAIRLLKGLHKVNPRYNFLQCLGAGSILSTQTVVSQQNFNVALLLTILQRDSEETQKKAERAVEELQNKAVKSREQSERAQFAKAASTYAIASGSLELYRETVIWQQRYVRDPLTVKVIFGRDAVMTLEGIELLSGIPQPVPKDITLAEIASEVGKANEILKIFNETMLIAKREPSFHEPDWKSVTSLFSYAINQRVTQAEDLQKHLNGPEADLYTAIWAGTLALLESVSVSFISMANQPIKTLLKTLPPTALAATTKAMLEAGNLKRANKNRQPGDDILERLSYEALLQLAKSERPELAQPFILQTILERPDASSWHRQLLSVSFMNSLSAKDAREMLLTFATSVGEKLEEQSYVKVDEAKPAVSGVTQPPSSTPPESLVKITTVKYLAQLLDNAEFISADAAVEVLLELLKAGTHLDIRLATLHSLLSLLNNLCSGPDENWRSNPLVEKIMKALETVIPIIGSVNERRPPQLKDWEEAKKTGKLPEISDISRGLPPLMSAMISAPDSWQYPGLRKMQPEFVMRYLLPVLRLSQAEHRKWIVLFLAKHKANLTVDDLPPIPLTWKVWETLVKNYPKLIPETVLDDYNKHIITTIAPPAALKEFNNLLKKNTDLSNVDPEVQHWQSNFGQSTNHYAFSGTQILVRMIHHDRPSSLIRNGITFSKVLDIVMTHASLLLADYENYTAFWNDFVQDLRPPTKFTYPSESIDSIRSVASTWQKTGKLALEKTIALVSEKKKKHTKEQKRSLLPSTTKLRLWLLPFPCFPSPADVDHECKNCANELVELLSILLEGETNALRWPKIAEDALTVTRMLNTPEERLIVGSYVGEIRRSSDRATHKRSSALNYVQIALAMNLIELGREGLKKTSKIALSEQERDLAERLRKRVKEWQNDSDEAIRDKAAEWKWDEGDLWRIIMTGE